MAKNILKLQQHRRLTICFKHGKQGGKVGTTSLPRDIKANERLIFTLDVSNVPAAMAFVRELRPTVKYFKVGPELFLAGGLEVNALIGRAERFFWTLKCWISRQPSATR